MRAFLLAGLLGIMPAGILADELSFEIFGGERSSETAPVESVEGLAFDIFRGREGKPVSTNVAAAKGRGLDCDIFGGAHKSSGIATNRVADSPTRPLVYVYETPGCLPCLRLKRAIESATLRFDIEYRSPPEWVQATPTFHWRGARGWLQYVPPMDDPVEALSQFERVWSPTVAAVPGRPAIPNLPTPYRLASVAKDASPEPDGASLASVPAPGSPLAPGRLVAVSPSRADAGARGVRRWHVFTRRSDGEWLSRLVTGVEVQSFAETRTRELASQYDWQSMSRREARLSKRAIARQVVGETVQFFGLSVWGIISLVVAIVRAILMAL